MNKYKIWTFNYLLRAKFNTRIISVVKEELLQVNGLTTNFDVACFVYWIEAREINKNNKGKRNYENLNFHEERMNQLENALITN